MKKKIFSMAGKTCPSTPRADLCVWFEQFERFIHGFC